MDESKSRCNRSGFLIRLNSVQFMFHIVLFVFFMTVRKIKIRFLDDDAGKRDERDEVRDGHEAVHDIREDPDGLKLQEGAGSDECDEDEAVRHDALRAEKIDAGTLAVIVPAQDGREGEENQRNREYLPAKGTEHAAEGIRGHHGAGGVSRPGTREYE